jgi:hypothetical protein
MYVYWSIQAARIAGIVPQALVGFKPKFSDLEKPMKIIKILFIFHHVLSKLSDKILP